ncbi:uncharacterized protein LOC135835303 [Planococcus citri]|uniref:uncharacterized protein LOC135835303 n=1 Tax=Planococcus citri TaxID=170843 RepID=UPI0031F85385
MHISKGIYILILFATFNVMINSADGDSKTVKPETATKEDVDSLIPITYTKALPVVLIKTNQRLQMRPVVGLKSAEIKDGRFVHGTEFYTMAQPPTTQIFYCPDPKQHNTCLSPKEFTESQELQCNNEQIPVIEENSTGIFRSKQCGPEGSGILLKFVYKMCDIDESVAIIPTSSLQIYSFCYNRSSKTVLYVDHYINSVNLLSEKLLYRERAIEFERSKETYYDFIDEDYYTMLDKAAAKFESQYKFQKLVPTENMAFATWRRPTNHYVNFALQHKKLFDLWNKINIYIRMHAIQYTHQHETIEYFIQPRSLMTGVFDIPDNKEFIIPDEEKNQIPKVWITVVTDNRQVRPYKGLAILMNNFVEEETTQPKQTDETSTSKQQFIDRICGMDYCDITLTKKFSRIGGQVRCCELTKEIMLLFAKNESVIKPMEEVLHINGITYYEDLHEDDDDEGV